MADAKIKKIIGNVSKLNYFHAYIVNMSFYVFYSGLLIILKAILTLLCPANSRA